MPTPGLPLFVEFTVTNIATLAFTDQSSRDTGVFIVDVDVGVEGVRLCLSLRGNGDTEAVLSRDDVQRVIQALTEAVRRSAPA